MVFAALVVFLLFALPVCVIAGYLVLYNHRLRRKYPVPQMDVAGMEFDFAVYHADGYDLPLEVKEQRRRIEDLVHDDCWFDADKADL